MKPSLLIDKQIEEVTRVTFTVGERVPVTLFQEGLAGVEKLTLQILNKDADGDESVADAAAWTTYTSGGVAQVLDVDNTVLTIPSPGVYALLTEGATVDPIRAGVFGN